jgi:hypothetical protein
VKRVIRTIPGIAAVLLLALAGCGPSVQKQVAAMNGSNIQRLSNLYAAHQNIKAGTGPKDEAAFKAFIKDFDKNKLEMMGVDPNNLDALFKSERDGQPFKIRYKVGGGRGSVDPVIFEASGKGGKKQVGFTGGKVEDVDDAQYAQLWSGKPGAVAAGGSTVKGSVRPSGVPAGAPTGPPGK